MRDDSAHCVRIRAQKVRKVRPLLDWVLRHVMMNVPGPCFPQVTTSPACGESWYLLYVSKQSYSVKTSPASPWSTKLHLWAVQGATGWLYLPVFSAFCLWLERAKRLAETGINIHTSTFHFKHGQCGCWVPDKSLSCIKGLICAVLSVLPGGCSARVVTVSPGPLIRVEGQPVSIRCDVNDYGGPSEQVMSWRLC